MDLVIITRIMNRSIMELYDEGEISQEDFERCQSPTFANDSTAVTIDTTAFYGFSPNDVATVHTHKQGVGDGVWFRLKDGRVFNKAAEPDDSSPALYDRVKN